MLIVGLGILIPTEKLLYILSSLEPGSRMYNFNLFNPIQIVDDNSFAL